MGFEKRGRFYAAIEHVGFLGPAGRYLPDVLQGDARIGGKSNGGLLRIGPALPEIVAGSQEGAPVTRRRSPYAVLAPAAIIGHRVNTVPMEIGTTDLPTAAPSVRAKDECSLRCSHQQKKVSLPNMRMSHAVQDRSPGWAKIGAGIPGNDCARLNGFQSGLNFTCALITLHRLLGQAALDNGP